MPSPIDAFSIAVVEPLSIFAKAQIVQTSRRSNNISLLLSIRWALFARIEGSFCRVIQIDELDIPRHPPQVQPRHGNRQLEPPPPRADRIYEQRATTLRARRLVRVTRHLHADPSRRRVQIQLVQIV